MNYDSVNHPEHYISKTGIEVIDVIRSFVQDLDGMKGYLVGNILKYMCRWNHKNGLEDLQKARWYLNYLIDILEAEERAEKESRVYSSEESCQIPELFGKRCLDLKYHNCDWCERMDELDLINEQIKLEKAKLNGESDPLHPNTIPYPNLDDFWQEGDDGKC